MMMRSVSDHSRVELGDMWIRMDVQEIVPESYLLYCDDLCGECHVQLLRCSIIAKAHLWDRVEYNFLDDELDSTDDD